MVVFYSIHAYDEKTRYSSNEDRIDEGILYQTFEQACEAIEKRIKKHIEYLNCPEEQEVYKQPNREEMKRKLDMGRHLDYYESVACRMFVISKWEVCE